MLSLRSFIVFSCIFLTTACGSHKEGNSPVIPVSSVIIQQIQATNLSEDRHALSSNKDEILLLVYYIKGKNTFLKSHHFGFFDITVEESVIPLDMQINFTDITDTRLIIALIEKDTDRSPSQIDGIFRDNFHLVNRIDDQKEALQLKLNDDDLLDMKILNLSKMSAHKDVKLKFWGVHLFDSYEYYLNCKFE